MEWLLDRRVYSFTHCCCSTLLLCVSFSFHTQKQVSEQEGEVYKYQHVCVIVAYKDRKENSTSAVNKAV